MRGEEIQKQFIGDATLLGPLPNSSSFNNFHVNFFHLSGRKSNSNIILRGKTSGGFVKSSYNY